MKITLEINSPKLVQAIRDLKKIKRTAALHELEKALEESLRV